MAVIVPIVSEWNPKGVDRAMADIQKAEGKLGKTKAGLEKAFLPATAALAGLGAAAWEASKSAEELVSSQAALDQVFSQMGYGDAAGRVKDLADELERTLGIDEKLIMQVQTSLGTFGELAASTDEAGGAFDRATLAALDLAAAGHAKFTQARDLAAETHTARAMNTTRQFGRDQRANIFVEHNTLAFDILGNILAVAHGHIL